MKRICIIRLEIELVHTISSNSPFFNQTVDDITHADFVLILFVSGLDENLHDMVHKKHEYGHEAMRWNSKFIPMLDWDSRHEFIELDLNKISAVISSPNGGGNGAPVSIDIASSLIQESICSSKVTDERVGHCSQRYSKGLETKDTIPLKLENGSGWELSDDYDVGDTIKRSNESLASIGSMSNSSLTPNNADKKGDEVIDSQAARAQSCQSSRSAFSYEDHDHHLTGNLEAPSSDGLLAESTHIACSRLFDCGRCDCVVAYNFGALGGDCGEELSCVSIDCVIWPQQVHEPLEQHTQINFSSKYNMVFFFCVQTISTVGYGSLSPRQDSDIANFFVFLLVFSGLFVSTLLADYRTSSLRVITVFQVRNIWPIINLCNTLTHIIDESSPLYHLSTDDLLSGDHFFVVLFTGLDKTISETMIARKAYHACDILVDHHFEDNITLTPDGVYIDLDAINATYFDPDVSSLSSDDQDDSEESPSASSNPDANNSPRYNFQLLTDNWISSTHFNLLMLRRDLMTRREHRDLTWPEYPLFSTVREYGSSSSATLCIIPELSRTRTMVANSQPDAAAASGNSTNAVASEASASQKRDVYVTGFGKFGDILENPTTFLAQKLAGHPKVTEAHVLEVAAESESRYIDGGGLCNAADNGGGLLTRW
ncbi:unnamed protein product [Phytophthora fragariaefolia]|uniref:Unnamed protein product n=1 Tax=Phytophthora fragariaefolia TaxID=1490495 RepID=A0A9W7CZQ1_9STRA|nr:unnamed protein product [Phytophthora fragariaefolia]